MFEQATQMLGLKVRDKVTGFEGVATSIDFDLYGCVQVIVQPPIDKDGKRQDSLWFDIKRLTTGERVMPVPNFAGTKFGDENGPAERPALDPSGRRG